MLYLEAGDYRTAKGLFSFMKAGLHDADVTKLRGDNPYLRVALNHAWGANTLMVGATHMTSRVYDTSLGSLDAASVHRYRDLSLDMQYQYLLDPHAWTAQLVYSREKHDYPAALAGLDVPFVDAAGNALPVTSASDRTRLLRARLSYVWQARYGGGVSLFDLTGSTNSANQSSGYDPESLTITSDATASAPSTRVNGNLSGNPATRGATIEGFWMPLQNIRIGLQFTGYVKYNGARLNYDGFGRNARDNNSLFLYAWAAY